LSIEAVDRYVQPYSAGDVELARSLAGQAAVAIENARLYEASTRWSRQLQSLQEVGNALEKAAGPGFVAKNWMDENRALFRALRLERVVTFLTIGLIVFVAALNILISLIMMVMEKTKDVAVLISMGAKRRQIRGIFMFQGVLIGVIGTVAGLILGYGVAIAGAKYHFVALSAEVYSIDYLPFAPRLIDGVLIAAVALLISFVATLYPSWSAARVLPAEALRYE